MDNIQNKKSKSSIKRAKRKELKRQRTQRITDFIHHYNNNTLHLMKDDIYLYEDEVKEIIDILSKGKNKIHVTNEIILKTGQVLPKLSLRINRLHLYNGNISYQNFVNIYKKLNFQVSENSDEYYNNVTIANDLLFLICNIYMTQKNNELLYSSKNYISIKLTYERFKRLYYVSFKLYKYLNYGYKQINVITFILADLYKCYLQNMFINKQKKFFLSIIIQLLILEFKNSMYTINSWAQDKPFMLVLDILISNWNLLPNKYKKILRNKSEEWIYFLKENNNKYLQYINEYIYIIQRL